MNFLVNPMMLIGTIVLRGFVLKIVWGWFVVPLGIAVITIPHALGLAAVVTYLTYTIPTKEIEWEVVMTTSIAISLFTLLFGYIFQLFM